EECDPSQRPPGEAFVHGLGLAVYRAAADYLTANRDRLLEQVESTTRLVAE
ncbi:MAG: PadR family transcriptional regulator, partial [Alphaproteobacteria bacterium]